MLKISVHGLEIRRDRCFFFSAYRRDSFTPNTTIPATNPTISNKITAVPSTLASGWISTVTVLSSPNHEQGVRIRVTDNGIGLRSEDQKRVFEKYFRVSTGNVHDIKGFGLGLSYVRMMVQAHGGRVGVHSEFNHGATFEVDLPFEPVQAENGATSPKKDRK